MLNHVILGTKEEIEIRHRGGAVQLRITRDDTAPGSPWGFRVFILPGEQGRDPKPFTASRELGPGADFNAWEVLHHAGERMRFRIRYGRHGRERDRFIVTFDDPTRQWTFHWQKHTLTLPPPEPRDRRVAAS